LITASRISSVIAESRSSNAMRTDTATYIYDALGRPISETARRGATGTPRTTTFGYLGMSNLVNTENVKKSDGTVVTDRSYTYDAFGHRISLTNTPGPGAP
jgi:YD repeat-containing protein